MVLKSNFYVIKIKRNILPIMFLLFTCCLFIFSKSNLSAVKSGLSLWTNSVIPSLFPFFVATELLMHTNIIYFLGNLLNRFMQPLFNIRGEGSFAFIMGIVSGYPIGAKIACDFRRNNICSKQECERLLSFTNNSSPLFIIGTVGILMFKNTTIGILLFITHLLACFTVGFIFRYWKRNENSKSYNEFSNTMKRKNGVTSLSNLGEILAESITSSISTILLIGGFIVIFSIIISILKVSGLLNVFIIMLSPIFNILHLDTAFIQGLLTGSLEITNGINYISNIASKKISINIIFTAFLLGFGGISIFLQVLSIIYKSDLSIRPYLYGKILHGFLAAFYTYVFIWFFPMLNFDL